MEGEILIPTFVGITNGESVKGLYILWGQSMKCYPQKGHVSQLSPH